METTIEAVDLNKIDENSQKSIHSHLDTQQDLNNAKKEADHELINE